MQLPAVQQFGAQKLTAYLANRLETKVTIGRFTTDWRNSLVLKDIYVEDQNQDTLLYAGRLGLDLNLLALKNQKLKIRTASLSNATLKLSSRLPDSVYNFKFIFEALKKPAGKESSGIFYFELNNLNVKNTRLQLSDPVKGKYGSARIGSLNMKTRGLYSGNPVYDFGKLQLENSAFRWIKTRERQIAEKPGKLNYTFSQLTIRNLRAAYENAPKQENLVAVIGKCEVKAEKTDLEKSRLDLSAFKLENAALTLTTKKQIAPDSANNRRKAIAIKKTPEKPGWAIWLNDGKLKNIDLQYRNLNYPAKPRGLDLNRLHFRKINLQLGNVYYDLNGITGLLKDLQFQEKSGFKVTAGASSVKAGALGLALKNTNLKTPGGFFKGDLEMKFPEEKKRPGRKERTTFMATIRSAKIAPAEVLFLAPELGRKPLFRKSAQQPISFSGKVWGQADDLHFRQFRLRLLTGTVLDMDGNIRHLSDEKNRETNLKIRRLTSNRPDLNVLRPNTPGKAALNYPERLTLSGNLQNQPGNLRFQELDLAASNGFRLQVTGQVTGGGKPLTDLKVRQLSTSRQALLELLPAGTITPEVQLPDHIRFAGTYRGYSLQDFALKGTFNTSFGNVITDLKIMPVQRFSGHIELEKFDLGKLMKQEKVLGPVTGKADFKGRGFKVKTMELEYKANVKKFVYKEETFHNIRLEGSLNQKIYQLNGNLANAALQGLGHKLKQVKPKNIDLKKADPTRLIPKKVEPKKMVPKFLRKKKKPSGEEDESGGK